MTSPFWDDLNMTRSSITPKTICIVLLLIACALLACRAVLRNQPIRKNRICQTPSPPALGDSNSRARRFTGHAPDDARRTLPEEHPDPEDSRPPGATLEDTLGEIWSSVVTLILYPVVFFAVAYTQFMRTDIR